MTTDFFCRRSPPPFTIARIPLHVFVLPPDFIINEINFSNAYCVCVCLYYFFYSAPFVLLFDNNIISLVLLKNDKPGVINSRRNSEKNNINIKINETRFLLGLKTIRAYDNGDILQTYTIIIIRIKI